MNDPSKTNPVPSAKSLRRQRGRRLAVRFAIWVLGPTFLAVIYFGCLATNRYESRSLFSVQSADGGSATGIEALLGVVPGGGASRDTLAVREYILSRDMLATLAKEHGFADHYRKAGADWFSRLGTAVSNEKLYEYYLEQVAVEFDTQSGVLTLTVRAFSAQDARRFAQAILKSSERMVNELSRRAREDSLRFAQQAVDEAEVRLSEAYKQIAKTQQRSSEFNPLHTASAGVQIQSGLEGELARAQAELRQARGFMAPTAPKVIELGQRVASLKQQIEAENRKLLDPKKGDLGASIAEYEGAMLEKEFATKKLMTAQSAFEVASMEAARQHRYLVVIATPSAPDDSTHPRRFLGVLTVFVVAFFSFGIGSLLVAAVREHAKI